MINAILKGLLNFIGNLIGIIFTPIDLIIDTAFPSLTNYISNINSQVDTLASFCSYAFGWFWNLIPPLTQGILTLYLTLLIAFYTISLTTHAVIKIIEIIKAIKIW